MSIAMRKIAENYFHRELTSSCKNNATTEFCSTIDESYIHMLPPVGAGVSYCNKTGIFLKGRGIAAHQDPDLVSAHGFKYAGSVFGLVSGELKLHVGIESIDMVAGDYVFFDDRIMHSTYAKKTWYGIAVQCIKP